MRPVGIEPLTRGVRLGHGLTACRRYVIAFTLNELAAYQLRLAIRMLRARRPRVQLGNVARR